MPETATTIEPAADCPVSRRPLTEEEREFVAKNYALSKATAARYARRHPHMDFDDLVSACHEGQIRAVKTWDSSVSEWSTYATYWMYQAMDRAAARGMLIRLPDNMLYGQEGNPKLREHADRVFHAARMEKGLEDLPGREPPERDGRADDALAALAALPPRERDIVERRFFRGELLRDIAAARGLSREWVRHLLDDALARMRRHMRGEPEPEPKLPPRPRCGWTHKDVQAALERAGWEISFSELAEYFGATEPRDRVLLKNVINSVKATRRRSLRRARANAENTP